MKELRLARGEIVLIDTEDYNSLKDNKWYLGHAGYAVYTKYASKNETGKYQTKIFYLHRLIMDAPKGMEVDHINGDKLDNRKSNLRVVDRKTNARNIHKVHSKSGHLGVYWSNQNKKWNAQLSIDGKSTSFGFYEDINEAIKARKEAELIHWSER